MLRLGGMRRMVSLALTPEAKPGDYVLIHAGYAIGTWMRKRPRKPPAARRDGGPVATTEGLTPSPFLERDRMKFIDEYRNPLTVRTLADDIRKRVRRPLRLMEFCGGHTHAILRFGIRELLPPRSSDAGRSRVPGLRHLLHGCRSGRGHGPDRRCHLGNFWRYGPCSRKPWRSSRRQERGGRTSGSSILPWTRWLWPKRTATGP